MLNDQSSVNPSYNGEKKGNGNGKINPDFHKNGNNNGKHDGSVGSIIRMLDSSNRSILSLIQKDPSISQVEMAERVGMSQSSVAMRLQKLAEVGLLKSNSGIDIKKLGMQMGRVDVYTKKAEQLLTWAKSCPLFMFGSIGIGNDHITLFLAAEDFETMHMIVDLHIRIIEGVSMVEFSPIVSWVNESNLIMPLELTLSKSETPPCGMMPYCPKCPANPKYDGRLWNGAELPLLVI